MDVGKSVRVRRSDGVARRLASSLEGNMQDIMHGWTEDNFHIFEETMDIIREGAPVQWAKLYMEAVKMGLTRNTNININISRQQDRENLQALVRARIPASIPDTPPVPEARPVSHAPYTPFEEIEKEEES